MIIGYTTGVFDLFHIGHLNLLRNARGMCDRLIVGVTTDELVAYKHKRSVIPFSERMEIVRSIRYVDAVIAQESLDKRKIWDKMKYDLLFVGDDWHESEQWIEHERKLKDVGVKVIYFPYMKNVSSTLINQTLTDIRNTHLGG